MQEDDFQHVKVASNPLLYGVVDLHVMMLFYLFMAPRNLILGTTFEWNDSVCRSGGLQGVA